MPALTCNWVSSVVLHTHTHKTKQNKTKQKKTNKKTKIVTVIKKSRLYDTKTVQYLEEHMHELAST